MAKPNISDHAIKVDKGLQARDALFDAMAAGKNREQALADVRQVQGVMLVMDDDDFLQANMHYREICRGVRFTLMEIQRRSRQ